MQGDEGTASLVRAVIEEQRQMLRISDRGEGLIGRIGAAARAAANALRHDGRPDMAGPIERAGATATSSAETPLSYFPFSTRRSNRFRPERRPPMALMQGPGSFVAQRQVSRLAPQVARFG